ELRTLCGHRVRHAARRLRVHAQACEAEDEVELRAGPRRRIMSARTEYESRINSSEAEAFAAELAVLADNLVAAYSKPSEVSPSIPADEADYGAAVKAQRIENIAYVKARRDAEQVLNGA